MRARDARTGKRRRLSGGHAHVVADLPEQAAHRDDQAAREQQHVEEQRAGGGDARHAQNRASRLPNETPYRKRECAHRLARFITLLRSSVQEDTRLARIPRGIETSTHRTAIRGVMRTKMSAVSYRH